MHHFIANLPDGKYFVDVIKFTDHNTVIVETIKGEIKEINVEDLILT
jgi:hypothetical protein